jgi:hypothetical protein
MKNFVYNFYSIDVSVGRVLKIASASEEERSKVSMRSKVGGFDGKFH